jgi:multimeric flavodoxin WrbA
MDPIQALAINCTLTRSPDASSTDVICSHLRDAYADHGVDLEVVRAVDHRILEGVTSDEGDGDEWPAIDAKVRDAQILVLATPIWMGNPSSVCRKVLERLDAMLSETDDAGRLVAFDKVGAALTVGNEDGAHNVGAQVFQGLNDIGYTIPANAQAYWVGEAMGSVDFKDLDEVPEKVGDTIATVARTTAHLARVLQADPYPA